MERDIHAERQAQSTAEENISKNHETNEVLNRKYKQKTQEELVRAKLLNDVQEERLRQIQAKKDAKERQLQQKLVERAQIEEERAKIDQEQKEKRKQVLLEKQQYQQM
jgi:hypothetical protein